MRGWRTQVNKSKPLQAMFTAVPPRYDLVNTLITWNMDKRWRKLAAQACLEGSPRRILDLCCGTGDLAIEIARRGKTDVEITGLDFSPPMLARAEEKASQAVPGRIKFVQGDVSRMPFASGYFDSVGISFGFRNLTYRNPLAEEHLSEIVRVIKPGGRFVVVESSQPQKALIRRLFHVYLRYYVYPVGAAVSRNKSAYRYLAESSRQYYSPPELKELLLSHGFNRVTYRPLFFGAAGLYVASRPIST